MKREDIKTQDCDNMVYVCFSSHPQVINKVYEWCSANWHSIYYSIETILPYTVIKMEKLFVVYKQIIKLSLGKYISQIYLLYNRFYVSTVVYK